MRVIIDDQVISFVSGIFSIRPVSRFTLDELENVPKFSWGSRSFDNKVLSLLITNNITISDLQNLTNTRIDEIIYERYYKLILEDRNSIYRRIVSIKYT